MSDLDKDSKLGSGGHRTASRVLDILELLAKQTESCPLRELSAELKAPKSSLLPLLRTLVQRDYIVQDRAGHYSLGPKVLELSVGAHEQGDLRKVANNELLALRNKTSESVILSRLTSDRKAIVFIDYIVSNHRVHAAAQVGEMHPVHTSSSGRLLLAYMPKEEREAIIESLDLTPLTEKTITNRDLLREEIKHIQQTGVCLTIDQTVLGRCAIAAPIFNHWGEAIAACVLNAPYERVRNDIPELTASVIACAENISQKIGYNPAINGKRYLSV